MAENNNNKEQAPEKVTEKELNDPQWIKQKIESIVRKHCSTPYPEVIFGMCAGSWAFHLNVATSDFDWFGIYVGDADEMLGLCPCKETLNSKEGASEDYALYEIKYYCELILKGNPKMIEPLFAPRLVYQGPAFQTLQKSRKCCLSKNTVTQYIQYAGNKVRIWKKTNETKQMYHGMRLLNEAKRMVDGGEPLVWLDGPEREFLLSIRSNSQDPETLQKQFDTLDEYCKNRVEQLPNNDVAMLSKWLEDVRLRNVNSETAKIEQLPNSSQSASDLKLKAQNLLSKFNVKGELLCVVPSGSCAYGTALPDSRFDYIGVFVAPTRAVVSLFPPPARVDETGTESTQKVSFCQGLCLFEVGYFLTQISNLRFVETLFYNGDQSYETKTWQDLKAQKAKLLSTHIINHIRGVVEGKLKSYQKDEKSAQAKTLYHSVRTLNIALALHQQKDPKIFGDKQVAESLMEIRAGKVASKQTLEKVEQLMKSLPSPKEKTQKKESNNNNDNNNNNSEFPPLVSNPDKNLMSNWLIHIRKG